MRIKIATAIAPANIAFIKYWGKKDEKLRLPLNSSISMNLGNCLTTTTVEFSPKYKEDSFLLLENKEKGHKKVHVQKTVPSGKEAERVFKHLNRVRELAGIKLFAKVVSQNNFPKGSGIASSASGFAALTFSSSVAAGLTLSERELGVLARLGSGSACRSIPDGFVEWKYGETNEASFAYSLYNASYWEIRDIILLVDKNVKKISSSEGMKKSSNSPLMKKRLQEIPLRIKKIRLALKKKNFSLLGKTCEEEAVNFQNTVRSQNPVVNYWPAETEEIINNVKNWRKNGLTVYFTVDAGSNVHLLCQKKDEQRLVKKIKEFDAGLHYIINKPVQGVRLIQKHLF